MSDYPASRIQKLPYFNITPLRNGRFNRKPYVIGFDSEADGGKPFLFQFAHPDGRVDLIYPNKKDKAGFALFFNYLWDNCKAPKTEYIIVGFNLQYEWTQIFRSLPLDIRNAREFDISVLLPRRGRIRIRAFNNKPYTLTVTMNKNRRVKFIDGYAFITSSLDNVGKVLGFGRKLKKPDKFGKHLIKDPEFIKYAKQDAILTQKLGEYIVKLHKQFDVQTCISAPQYASRVFRKNFLDRKLDLPEEELEQLGLWAYHGGKNGFYLDKPQIIKKAWFIDIRSAYPEAMAQLPNITRSVWRQHNSYVANTHSIWHIKAIHRPCKYHSLQSENGEWINTDGIIETTTTGYEIDVAVKHGDIEILSAYGYSFEGESGGPLKEYVDRFYHMKRHASTEGEKQLAKLLLNSLYGKFFQKISHGAVGSVDIFTGEYARTDPTQEYDYTAGGLYHPPIAALITGYVRAKMHRLEHRYDSVMTSTDGLFGLKQPDSELIGEELGQLDAVVGTLRIIRERGYYFKPHNRSFKPKYAFHGFRGTKEQFLRIPLKAGFTYHYTAPQMITLKMSRIQYNGQSYEPGEFAILPFDFAIPP
jgi:hypothetical protein